MGKTILWLALFLQVGPLTAEPLEISEKENSILSSDQPVHEEPAREGVFPEETPLVQENLAENNPPASVHLVESLKGVLLVSDSHLVEKAGVDIKDFQSLDLTIPGGIQKINERLASSFIGKPVDKETLLDLKRQLVLHYRDQGYPLVAVEIPEQCLDKGTLQLVIIESTLGKVCVYNNRYFSTNQIKKNIRENQGEPISSNKLLSDIAWINQNPFRRADLVFAPGQEPKTTDIELYVNDRFPVQGYVGADNTGISGTGQARLFAGVHCGNMFGIGHMLSYQFTMSADYHKFWAHTLCYNAPLSWRHKLTVYGGYSEIHPDISGFHSKGRNGQASFRYQIPVGKFVNRFIQEIGFGFDYKNINSNLFFAQQLFVPVVTQAVNITQFYAGYSLGKEIDRNKLVFKLDGFWSPGKLVSNQSNHDFSSLQPGAVNHYYYFRAYLADSWTLQNQCAIHFQLRGQAATQNLISSEQFGLGGYDTVRGYPEREYNYDNAFCFNFELYAPSFSIFRSLKAHPDEMKFLGFFDFGTGRDTKTEFEPQWQRLISVGPGFRYKIADYLSARFDWGFRLNKVEFTGLGNRVHMGILASY